MWIRNTPYSVEPSLPTLRLQQRNSVASRYNP